VGYWIPSHETLINITLPYIEYNSNYLEKSNEDMVIPNKGHRVEQSDQMLIQIFDNILDVEEMIEQKYGSTMYHHQLLRLGILNINNYQLLSRADLEIFAKCYGIMQHTTEDIVTQIMVQQLSVLNEIRIMNPAIMSQKVTHYLINDATFTHRTPPIKMEIPHTICRSLPIPINKEYQESLDNQHIFIPPHLLVPPTGFTPLHSTRTNFT